MEPHRQRHLGKLPRFMALVLAFCLTIGLPLWVLSASAATVPHTFVNGEIADADEVNENFAALLAAINDQQAHIDSLEGIDADTRVSDLEATVASLQTQVSALQTTVAGHTTSITNLQSGVSSNGFLFEIIDDVWIYDQSLVTDANAKAHIAYFDYDGFLKYATNASGTWNKEVVDNTGFSDYGTCSLDLDANGKAHIAYGVNSLNKLKYATNATGSWVKEDVDGFLSFSVNRGITLSLDSSGKAHIAYGASSSLKYASNASGGWSLTGVDSPLSDPIWPSMVLDTNGKAHVGYSVSSSTLKYATNATGSWVKETVNSSNPQNMGRPTLMLDSNSKAHIGYADNGILKYVANVTGSWSVESVAVGTSAPLLILDTSGKAHMWNIGYGDAYVVSYATNASGSWQSQFFAPAAFFASSGLHTLAQDTNGKIHYVAGLSALAYARQE